MEDRQQRIAVVGIDNIISAWETMNDGYPFYAVYYNRNNKYFQYNKDNMDAAKDFLYNNLEVLQNAGDTAMYYLNIYSESKANYPNSGMIASFPFRLNPYTSPNQIGAGPGGADAFVKALQDAHTKELELTRQLSEANQNVDWFDRIGGLLETPGAAGAIVPIIQPIIAGLMGLVGKISGIPMTAPAPYIPPGIGSPGNTDQDLDEQLDLQLDRLSKHGDLLQLLTTLANFADKNPDAFKGYFEMLKQMK